jgi:membrane protein implicated in regulation of membrane protease activity
MFGFFLVVLIGLALVLGFFVHWIIPSVDVGSGAILGALSTAIALLTTVVVVRYVDRRVQEEEVLEDTLREYQKRRKSRRKKS